MISLHILQWVQEINNIDKFINKIIFDEYIYNQALDMLFFRLLLISETVQQRTNLRI